MLGLGTGELTLLALAAFVFFASRELIRASGRRRGSAEIAIAPGWNWSEWLLLGAVILAAILTVLSGCAHPRQAPGVHYFRWANLFVQPPVPEDQISRERAVALAEEGQSFYVAEYGGDGLLQLLKTTPEGRTIVVWEAPPPR